ncbi:MAG: hypothetical protein OXC66_09610 [Roseovarius sp.]|nr:hypothetical protein [Roseovarius sp.]
MNMSGNAALIVTIIGTEIALAGLFVRGVRHDIEIISGDVASLRGDAGNLRERMDYVEGMLAARGNNRMSGDEPAAT